MGEHINSYLITNYWKNKGIKVDKEGAMLHLNKITKNETKKKKKKEKKSIKKTMSKTKKSMKKKKGHKAAKHSKKKKQKRTKTAKKLYWEDSDVEQDDEESDNSNC